MTAEQVVSKTEFARMRGVSQARVTQWIRDGKLPQDALVGTGRSAQIRVAMAQMALDGSLELSRKLGYDALRRPPSGASDDSGDYNRRIASAKAATAELALRDAVRREKLQTGTYMLTGDARDAWAKELHQLLEAVELWLPELAKEAVEAPCGDVRAMTSRIKRSWREFRARRADLARSAAVAVEPLVEDTTEGATEPSTIDREAGG